MPSSTPQLRATIAVPTLAADSALQECLASLQAQTCRDFEVVVIDNSGEARVPTAAATRVIHNSQNVGFGAAVNQAFQTSTAPYLATLNDDAVAHPNWLAALIGAMEQRYEIGMCASQVRLAGLDQLDSAGMLMCPDGSSKQRGHGEPPSAYPRQQEVLFPSGSAALYRREMLEEIGFFDEDFFLYCEDTDLGLRARWAAWECLYVPTAIVEHKYSHSAGRASPLKAYYVERNRLYTILKNFPAAALLRAPWYSGLRYVWHAIFASRGQGTAARFTQEGNHPSQLPLYVLRAHAELIRNLPGLLRKRRSIKRRLNSRQFQSLLRSYSISPRQVAAL